MELIKSGGGGATLAYTDMNKKNGRWQSDAYLLYVDRNPDDEGLKITFNT